MRITQVVNAMEDVVHRRWLRARRVQRIVFAFGLLLTFMLAAPTIRADKSGVSPNKLSLPDGAGSISGVGENVEPDLNMGLMTYRVPIEVPGGYVGLTPELALVYNSGSGNSTVGAGWALSAPVIERMTSRGLPTYGPGDTFAAGGGEELVRTESGAYRARYERGFTRYTWLDAEDGTEGYWKAEFRDGRVAYFGATATGDLVETARAPGNGGTFAYYLVEMVDVFGHRLRYEYDNADGTPHPTRISYAFEGASARHEIVLGYEARPDELSDCKPGLELKVSSRLASIETMTEGRRVRKYSLRYELAQQSGGLSRLSRVTWVGMTGDDEFPVRFHFGYSAPLGATKPAVVKLSRGTGVDLRAGTADLVDLNSDSLPDLVETGGGAHRIFLQEYDDAGQRFAGPVLSMTGALVLESPNTELFDLDGDGTSDMVDAETRSVLRNSGNGDWRKQETLDALDMPNLADDANLRFLDFDNDKSIDLIHASQSSTFFYANRGGGHFELVQDGVDFIGQAFQTGLQLADMNGDGLLDPVLAANGDLQWRLSLGLGRWSEWRSPEQLPEGLQGDEQLVDLNGDALADLVAVRGDRVIYSVNTGGGFAPLETLDSGSVTDLPERTSQTSLRFADMNGSGTTDIVYIDASGSLTFVELFPTRPNLMTNVNNGVGKTIDVAYGSTSEHMRRDGGPASWEHRLPHPMLTVDEIVVRDARTKVEQRQAFHYANGYYDGVEKQFRGFADVTVTMASDEFSEPGVTKHHFDVGLEHDYRKGLPLSETTYSNDEELVHLEHDYADCAVAGAEGAAPAVHFACPSGLTQTIKERSSDESAWKVVAESYAHDGFGNTTLTTKEGVLDVTGDEAYEETHFIDPGEQTGGRWLLGRAEWVRSYGKLEGRYREQTFYYDNAKEPGVLDRGLVTLVTARLDAGKPSVKRQGFVYDDENGAVLEASDGKGNRRTYEYDELGLLPLTERIHFDVDGYALAMAVEYHPVLETVTRATSWMREVDGEVTSTERATEYDWTSFGQLDAIAKPGDTLAEATDRFRYPKAPEDPEEIVENWIAHDRRSVAGKPFDLTEVQCFDGLGHKLQTRTLIEPGKYQVSGFTAYGALGKPVREFQPYTADTEACDAEGPGNLSATTELHYDATGRELRRLLPIAAGESRSEETTLYLPLRTETMDAEDTDLSSPHYQTWSATKVDGLGRTTMLERTLNGTAADKSSLEVVPLTFQYDDLSGLVGYQDVGGNTKTQTYDLLGRITTIDDPDSHITDREFDGADNLSKETDARGTVRRSRFDEANRLIEQWEEGRADETRIAYTYDALPGCDDCTNAEGKLARVLYPGGEDAFGYDDRGQLVYTRRTIDGHAVEIKTKLDNVGRAVARVFPTGHRIEYQFDGASRPTAIPGFVDLVDYEEHGLPRQLDLANGVSTNSEYDGQLRLAHLVTKSPSLKLQDNTYTRDRVGNIVAIEDKSEFGGAPSANATYTYDAWYRLVGANLDAGRPAAEEQTFAYDATDNIVSKTSSLLAKSPDHVGDYTYGENGAGPHAVTNAGDMKLAYDAAGNMTRHGSDQYCWDFLGRMYRARRFAEGDDESECPESGAIGDYAYGPSRERIKKLEAGHTTYYFAPDFEVRDGTAFVYPLLGNARVATVVTSAFSTQFLADLAPGNLSGHTFTSQPDGKVTAADAWIADSVARDRFQSRFVVDDALTDELLAASARNSLRAAEDDVTFSHFDHLGSIVVRTATDSPVIDRQQTYPFGTVRVAPMLQDSTFFTGKEADASTGLVCYPERYLEPRLGHWLAPDRLFSTAQTQPDLPYAYVQNNPINHVDPTGEAEKKADAYQRFFGVSRNEIATVASVGRNTRAAFHSGNLTPTLKAIAADKELAAASRFVAKWTLLVASLSPVGRIANAATRTQYGFDGYDLWQDRKNNDQLDAGLTLGTWAMDFLHATHDTDMTLINRLGYVAKGARKARRAEQRFFRLQEKFIANSGVVSDLIDLDLWNQPFATQIGKNLLSPLRRLAAPLNPSSVIPQSIKSAHKEMTSF